MLETKKYIQLKEVFKGEITFIKGPYLIANFMVTSVRTLSSSNEKYTNFFSCYFDLSNTVKDLDAFSFDDWIEFVKGTHCSFIFKNGNHFIPTEVETPTVDTPFIFEDEKIFFPYPHMATFQIIY